VLVTTEGELPPGIPLLAESLFTWIPPGVEISTDASEPGELVQIVRLPGRANADTLDEDDGHEATTLFYSARETPEQPSLREDERHESFDINGELGVLRGRHGDMLLTWRYGPYLLTLSNGRETNRDGETGLMQEELLSLARNILPVGVASREGERVEQGWPLWWRPDTEVMNSPASRLPPPRGPIAWRDGSRLLRFDEPYLDGAECRQTLTASLDALRTCASWQGEPDPIGFVIRVWQLARDYDLLRRVVRFHPAVLGVYSVGLGPLLILNLSIRIAPPSALAALLQDFDTETWMRASRLDDDPADARVARPRAAFTLDLDIPIDVRDVAVTEHSSNGELVDQAREVLRLIVTTLDRYASALFVAAVGPH